MAHAKTQDYRDVLVYQCGKGHRSRHVNSVGFIVGFARTNNTAPNRVMADIIASGTANNETEIFPIFTSPCAARVVRIYANGTPFVDMDTSGTVVATTSKANISASDTALGAGITVGAATVPAADTAIDDVLVGGTTMDLLEGQHVYVSVAASDHAVQTAVAYVSINVEWVPTEP